ncbi:MAG TPA: hypothetical protein VG871_08650, partial [Vicinamibacterales bacterium]|nr:hypothetical protein [Vicinamibacterales bacterium]
ACFVLIPLALGAQSPGPQPLPMPPAVQAPRDVPYPGTLTLSVDATDITRRIFHVHEVVPIAPGAPLVLLFPQWLPGNHAPEGRIDLLGGLQVHAGSTRVDWTRDSANVYAFHVTPPAGAASLDITFDFESPLLGAQGRQVMTPEMLSLQWNQMLLYPAGYFTRDISIDATLTVPDGWTVATALDRQDTRGNVVVFKRTSLNTLVDSPAVAGRYFKSYDLDPGGPAPVHLDVVADRPELLEAKPEQLQAHRNLVQQAYKLFGSHHYDHYDFLFSLSDHLGGIGLEHHRSSEDGSVPGYFTEWTKNADERDLLSHEYTHSWNGKFRRPADLWTPNYNVPMRDSLLWVYEGQTQYWGEVLAARAGLWTRQQALDQLAIVAATYDMRVGRSWRALQDTTNDPIIAQRRSQPWPSWGRREDYYYEGLLIWLDADTLIREKSNGRKSLDDFAKTFFGIDNGSYVTVTYQFDDVVKALNAVQPYDWAAFLRARLDGHGPGAPLDGFARGGYKLVYTETPSDYFKGVESSRNSTDLTYGLGLATASDGRLTAVMWDSPAFKASLVPGEQITAVNGTAFRGDRLKDAVTQAKTSGHIDLLVKNGDRFRTVSIPYTGGLRYPHLERTAATPARLDDILAPRS